MTALDSKPTEGYFFKYHSRGGIILADSNSIGEKIPPVSFPSRARSPGYEPTPTFRLRIVVRRSVP